MIGILVRPPILDGAVDDGDGVRASEQRGRRSVERRDEGKGLGSDVADDAMRACYSYNRVKRNSPL